MFEKQQDLLVNHLRRHNYLAFPRKTHLKADKVFNHASNLCSCTFHLLNVSDMAKEGDVDRAVMSLKAYVPFFYKHSPMSKYFLECLDMLLKVEVTSLKAALSTEPEERAQV